MLQQFQAVSAVLFTVLLARLISILQQIDAITEATRKSHGRAMWDPSV
jgi:hypothetical protein